MNGGGGGGRCPVTILLLQSVYSFRDILQYFKKGTFFIVKLHFGDSSSCYRGK